MPRRPIQTASAEITEVYTAHASQYVMGHYYPASGGGAAQRLLMRLGPDCPAPQPEQLQGYDTRYTIWYCDYAPVPTEAVGRGRPPQRMPEIKRWECTIRTLDHQRQITISSGTPDAELRDAMATLSTRGTYDEFKILVKNAKKPEIKVDRIYSRQSRP